jgi:prefoldin alpha subunit
MDQEAIMKIQMMEQETNSLNEQLKMVDSNVAEMNDLIASLEEIDSTDTKEIMANLGKRIFIPVDIREKKLIVEVGKGNFVKKSVGDTKKIVVEESDKLAEAKNQIMSRLNELQEDMNKMIMEFQKEQMEAHNNEHADAAAGEAKEVLEEDHVHGPDCNHEAAGRSSEDDQGHVHGPDCDHGDEVVGKKKGEDSIEDLAEGK